MNDINELIENLPEDAEEKLAEYIEKKDSILKDIGKEEALEEAAAQKEEKAETKDEGSSSLKEFMDKQKDAVKGIPNHVKVGTPGRYKGFPLKKEMSAFLDRQYFSHPKFAKAKKHLADNPDALEKVTKYVIDLIDKGYKLASLGPIAAKAAYQVGTNSEGGYIAPTEEMMELIHLIRYTSVALPNVTIIPMSTYDMTIPKELTAPAVGYVAEEGEITQAEGTFSQVTLTAKKIAGYSVASNELLQDNDISGGFVAMLTEQMVEGTANKIDSTIFIGTGDPVSGVFLSTGTSEVFSSGSTAFSELLESNIRNIIPNIAPRVRGASKWYMATSILWQYVRGLKTTDGAYLYNESTQGQAAPSMLWGYPIVEINDSNAPSTSAAATGFIVFGDLTGFYVGERLTDFTLFIDPYTKSQNYQTTFRFATRWAFAHALNTKYSRIVTAAS